MRKVILSMQVTLDGFVEGPGKEMDWLSYNDEEQWQDIFAMLRSADTFLLGRVMYPDYANYWRATLNDPSAAKNEIEYARIADKTEHIVFSKTLESVDWKNSRIVKGDIAEEIVKLKKQPGKNMVIWGGATLATAFMNLDLVDEYRIAVNPVILGGGKALFKDVKDRHKLKLIATKTFSSGAVLLSYETQRD